MAGDDEEHAVLLNNYFLTLHKKSWIAMGILNKTLNLHLNIFSICIGVSIYSGPCCFVLTKEDNQRSSNLLECI